MKTVSKCDTDTGFMIFSYHAPNGMGWLELLYTKLAKPYPKKIGNQGILLNTQNFKFFNPLAAGGKFGQYKIM